MKFLRVLLTILIIAAAIAAVILLQRKIATPAVVATSSTFSTPEAAQQTEVLPTSTIAATIEGIPTAAPLVLPPEDEASARLTVPAGFAIRIFADNLTGTPRFMAVSPQGDLYVSLFGGGQIALLADRNMDGLADGTEIVASGLKGPHGLEWHDGWLYVAEQGRVSRLQDGDNNGSLEIMETITENIPGSGGHSSRTLHFGPDGMLYVSAGSSCNLCAESDPRRAAILRLTLTAASRRTTRLRMIPTLKNRQSGRGVCETVWTSYGRLQGSCGRTTTGAIT